MLNKDKKEAEASKVEETEAGRKLRILKEIKSTVFMCLLAVVIVVVTNVFIAKIIKVEGHSMDTTLANGEMLILDRISYRFSEPARFDIVVFPHNTSFYIKRIIGMPGETIQIKDGEFYIDGVKLEGDHGNEPIADYFYGRTKEPVKLGADEYFCVGDNRNHSADSRTVEVGNVKRNIIMGKAIFRFYPFSRFGGIS